MHEHILEAIQTGELRIRPRWHFILKGTLMGIGVLLAFLLGLYLISLMVFAVRQTGAEFIPSFGAQGWLRFVIALPWLLIVFSILFIILVEILVRRYSFAYQRPLLYSAASIMVIVIGGGFLVASTSLPAMLRGPLYSTFVERELSDLHAGIVETTIDQGFILHDRGGRSIRVVITPETRRVYHSEFFDGDNVLVFGDLGTSTVQAFGIRKVFVK